MVVNECKAVTVLCVSGAQCFKLVLQFTTGSLKVCSDWKWSDSELRSVLSSCFALLSECLWSRFMHAFPQFVPPQVNLHVMAFCLNTQFEPEQHTKERIALMQEHFPILTLNLFFPCEVCFHECSMLVSLNALNCTNCCYLSLMKATCSSHGIISIIDAPKIAISCSAPLAGRFHSWKCYQRVERKHWSRRASSRAVRNQQTISSAGVKGAETTQIRAAACAANIKTERFKKAKRSMTDMRVGQDGHDGHRDIRQQDIRVYRRWCNTVRCSRGWCWTETCRKSRWQSETTTPADQMMTEFVLVIHFLPIHFCIIFKVRNHAD